MIETDIIVDVAEEEEYQLPDGWRWENLSNLGEFISGGTPSKEIAEYWNGSIPFVTGADITDIYIGDGNARAFLTEKGFNSGHTAQCPPRSIILVTRTRVGRVGIAAKSIAASQDITCLVCNPKLHPEFAYWYLHSLEKYLLANCRGSTILGLTREFVSSLRIPLPPTIAEQRRIAAELAEQLAAVERARVAAEAQLAAARALPAAFLREVFESDEAQEWDEVPLGDVGSIGAGITLGPKERTGPTRSVPYLRVANVKDGELDLSDVKEIEVTEQEASKYALAWGDLLLTEGGDPDKLGRGTYWQDEIKECLHQNHIFRVRFDLKRFSPGFLSLQIGSSYGKAYFLRHAKQTTGIATINQQVLANFPLLVPPLSVQIDIESRITSYFKETQAIHAAITAQLNAINRLPATLLRRAFTGGAGDGPAGG